jgi:hypothetical protein
MDRGRSDERYTREGLRVIRTARTPDEINAAARTGVRPLVKPVNPSPQVRSKIAVFQNRINGTIRLVGDYRAMSHDEDEEMVVDFRFYYPHAWPHPFAAYLIPRDLEVGERVYLEDLIEDIVGERWNQGDTYRLPACEATWNGEEFEIDYEELEDGEASFIG